MAVDLNTMRSIFSRVDRDGSGSITHYELQSALSNGLGTAFSMKTIQLMITMFDTDFNGTIGFDEFTRLFKYVQDWQDCFRRYDQDRSGSIDCRELHCALGTFGYRLSPGFVQMMIHRFDRTRRGCIAFDDFIYACVCLQTLTNAFRPYDTQMNGRATMSFEQFLSAAFSVVI